jgi:FtsP/CotA-like multicopper oxidase with cupredoxin domain
MGNFFTRSVFMRFIAVQVVGLTLGTAWAQLPNCPLRPASGSVVAEPLNLYSENGVLSLGLSLRNGVDSAGYTHDCYDYSTGEGMIEAPTLRLNPGDTLKLDLTDQLNLPASPASKMKHPMRMGHATGQPGDRCQGGIISQNSTNLHFHGLNVPPTCGQDDVINTLIQPNDPPFHYQIQIPTNEPPGLYWYHPHVHGFTTDQVNGGAAGAIIINGIEKIKPQVAGLTEQVLIVRQQFVNPGSWLPGPYELTLNFQTIVTPPLQTLPQIQVNPGEKQFWRVLNASTQAFLALQVWFESTPQNMELIAVDGVPVTGNPEVTTINVPPAGRAEFVMTGPPTGTAASFVDLGFDTGAVGNPNTSQLLASIVPSSNSVQSSNRIPAVAGVSPPDSRSDAATALRSAAAKIPSSSASSENSVQRVPIASSTPAAAPVQRFADLSTVKPTTTRKLYFSEAPQGSNGPTNYYLTVDGQTPMVFSPSLPPAIVTNVGAVEDWTIENHSSEEHAFHIHQIHFLVTAINGVPLQTPVMQDTVLVPYWNGGKTFPSVTVRMDFRDPEIAGTFVYHCHVLDHEDGGMMAEIQVNP